MGMPARWAPGKTITPLEHHQETVAFLIWTINNGPYRGCHAQAPKSRIYHRRYRFQVQCLGLIDEVAQGKTGRIVLLKHNRPIAAIVSLQHEVSVDLWGAMRGTVSVAPGADLTEPTGESWNAER